MSSVSELGLWCEPNLCSVPNIPQERLLKPSREKRVMPLHMIE